MSERLIVSARTVVTQMITSRRVRKFVRDWHGVKRSMSGGRKTLLVFLERGEPYSELLADVMPRIVQRYGVQVQYLTVPPPEKSAAPEPEKLADFARRDAQALRYAYDVMPSPDRPAGEGDPVANAALRASRGHYGSGMIWFEGEWYWGLDRLHHLERRLGAEAGGLLFPPVSEPETATGGSFDMFFSLRSPYSYLAMMRAPKLARQWQAEIELRPILPMVMRSLPVPREKRLYIVRDCKREAERFGLPFGKINDPLGAGVERGLAILCRAIPERKGIEFAQSFLSGVWAEGVNAASDAGLRAITERAGLDWSFAQDAMADESWRARVEANRAELFGLGLWGVPSFRVGNRSTFGQDRLWQVGEWLSEASDAEGAT
jgi:2-hydroxychromene-2-carboxylate isomerase